MWEGKGSCKFWGGKYYVQEMVTTSDEECFKQLCRCEGADP